MLWLSWGFPKFQNYQFATVFLIIPAWLGLNCCKPSTATPHVIHTSTGIFLVMNGEDDQLLHLLFICLSVSEKVLSAPWDICTKKEKLKKKRSGMYQESPVLILVGCLRCLVFLPSITPKPWQRFITPIQDSRSEVHLHTRAAVWAKVLWLKCWGRFSSPGNMAQVESQQHGWKSLLKLWSQASFYSWHLPEPLLHKLEVSTIIWGREDASSGLMGPSKFYPLVLPLFS